MNFFQVLALASQLIGSLSQLAAGQPVVIRTYLGKQHVEVTVQELPN